MSEAIKTHLELNLELDKAIEKIKEENAKSSNFASGNSVSKNPKTVLIQLPDGLKPKANKIQEELLKAIPTLNITFWAGDCYGACDTPNVKGFDLFIAFGHSKWKY